MLPEIKQLTPERNNFPTRWQAVIFRNYRMVSDEVLARVLECTADDIRREAVRLGLREGAHDPEMCRRGYITLIRNNWFLLPYDQLMLITGMSEERLDFVLATDDFLSVKLGKYKPQCGRVVYSPLDADGIAATERIAGLVKKHDTSERVLFDFYRDKLDGEPRYVTDSRHGIRMVHPYLSPCADPFITDTRDHLPDALLDDYARVGVNALLLHAVLSTLTHYPFDPSQSQGYETRRKNLRELIARAKKRGITVFLYLDEPRALPADVFERYGRPELGGHKSADGSVSLCLSLEENLNYLYNAVKELWSDIPEAGVTLTTKSEYQTHCTSPNSGSNCPRCSMLPPETMPVLVSNTVRRAMRDAGSDAPVIASMWAWTDEMQQNGIPKLADDIIIWSVSEWGLPIVKGGVEYSVIDYSISNPGPSPMARRAFELARASGHRACAKVQMSNSWELSAVPYLPVFDLELEHLQRLKAVRVDDFQLTWTLGSYPSVTFDLVNSYLSDPHGFRLDRWYQKVFGKNGQAVHEAVMMFCRGFVEYPFSCRVAYYSAKNLGVANRWSLTPNSNSSTMVCWTYDDPERFADPYPTDIYLSQFEKVITQWEQGCELLDGIDDRDALTAELALFARVGLLHLKADVLHTRYVICKKQLPQKRRELLEIFQKERGLCRELLELLPRSPLIGYETANHYFYTERDVIEKLIQLDGLTAELG